jgi:hypothetical protein
MTRILSRGIILATLASAALLCLSCDDANNPDLPPYHVAATFIPTGSPQDVYAKGPIVAIAQGHFGFMVLNWRDLSRPETLYTYDISDGANCTSVVLDTLHKYVGALAAGDQHGPYLCTDYTSDTGAYVEAMFIGLGDPISDFEVNATQDTIAFWSNDLTASDSRLKGNRFYWSASELRWRSVPNGSTEYVSGRRQLLGFGERGDGIFAIALGESGMMLFNGTTGDSLGSVDTPGIAYGCAWSGNYIVVADEYQVVIIDAANVNRPVIASTLSIPNADRLRKVAVDGSYAFALDEFDGLYVVDISNPHDPHYVQLLELYDPTSVYTDNGRVYATDLGRGVVVYTR